jgi:hypothetical protein
MQRSPFAAFRELSAAGRTAVAALAALAAVAAVLIAPGVLSVFVTAAPSSAAPATETWTGSFPIEGRAIPCELSISFAPPRVRVNDSPAVQVSLGWQRAPGLTVPRPSARLIGAGFDVRPDGEVAASGRNPLSWSWTFAPRSAGIHQLQVVFDREVIHDPAAQVADRCSQVTDTTISCAVEVLTARGLTSGQEAWAQAIGGLIGFAGAALALPLFTRSKGKK